MISTNLLLNKNLSKKNTSYEEAHTKKFENKINFMSLKDIGTHWQFVE